MELMTKEIEEQLPALYSQEHITDPICNLKFFTPDAGWTWYILEAEKQVDNDFLFFCKVISPIVPEGELGYVKLSELKNVRGSLGLPVERDLYFKPIPISQCK